MLPGIIIKLKSCEILQNENTSITDIQIKIKVQEEWIIILQYMTEEETCLQYLVSNFLVLANKAASFNIYF